MYALHKGFLITWEKNRPSAHSKAARVFEKRHADRGSTFGVGAHTLDHAKELILQKRKDTAAMPFLDALAS